MDLCSSPTLPDTREGFRALGTRALLAAPPPQAPDTAWHQGPSDFDLNPEVIREIEAGRREAPRDTPAAVLVPIVLGTPVTVLLTQRTAHLAKHAGQIAFPGGKAEAADSGPLATALREAQEEIGLDPALVEPIGFLDRYRTGTGFSITPAVGLVTPGFSLALDQHEVADAFEVPLAFLMDARNHQTHVRAFSGVERRFYAMPYEERFIWGATAGILRNMHWRLLGS